MREYEEEKNPSASVYYLHIGSFQTLLLGRIEHSISIGEKHLLMKMMRFIRIGIDRTGDVNIFQSPETTENLSTFTSKCSTGQTIEDEIHLEHLRLPRKRLQSERRAYRMIQIHQKSEEYSSKLPTKCRFRFSEKTLEEEMNGHG